MLTQNDIKELKKVLATKDDIEDVKTELSLLEHTTKKGVQRLEEKMDEGFKFNLDLSGEIEKERIKNEKRIKRLEQKAGLAITT